MQALTAGHGQPNRPSPITRWHHGAVVGITVCWTEVEEEVRWRGEVALVTYQGGAEAERFPRGDVPLAVVEEELTEQQE